jgi:hypothetical protein
MTSKIIDLMAGFPQVNVPGQHRDRCGVLGREHQRAPCSHPFRKVLPGAANQCAGFRRLAPHLAHDVCRRGAAS